MVLSLEEYGRFYSSTPSSSYSLDGISGTMILNPSRKYSLMMKYFLRFKSGIRCVFNNHGRKKQDRPHVSSVKATYTLTLDQKEPTSLLTIIRLHG